MKSLVNYAWCFDHGTLHRFTPLQVPWCTARWMPLDAYTDEVALGVKQNGWGGARFLHELPADQQIVIIEAAKARQ